MRKAEELSTATAPAWAAMGPELLLEMEPPAEKRAMSTPFEAGFGSSSTVMGLPLKVIVLPAERAEARRRSSFIGKLQRLSRRGREIRHRRRQSRRRLLRPVGETWEIPNDGMTGNSNDESNGDEGHERGNRSSLRVEAVAVGVVEDVREDGHCVRRPCGLR